MASKNIEQILLELQQQGYVTLPGFHGNLLKFEYATREEVKLKKVDELYQRLISTLKLNSYGECDFSLLIPAIISRRPKELGDLGGDYTIDGQHKLVMYLNSGHEGDGVTSGCPTMVMEHEYDHSKTVQENYNIILKKEAKLYQALNTLRKKLTRVDELRAEAVYGDPLACNIESVMKTLNLVSDRFGSKKKNAKEVKSFSQFYYALTSDYEKFGGIGNAFVTEKISSGYDLWTDIYGETPSGAKIHGNAFRAICFLRRFIDEGLTNGKQEKFESWCREELAKQFSQEKLIKGFGTFDSPRWTLYRILDKYNDVMTNQFGKGAPTIKGKTLIQAIEISSEPKFKHPDEDEWERICKECKK